MRWSGQSNLQEEEGDLLIIAKPAVSEEGQSGLKQEWTGEGGVRMLLFEWQEAGQRSSLSLSRLGLKET